MNFFTKNEKLFLSAIFLVYILSLLYLTVFRFGFYYDERQLNLFPFTDLIKIYTNAAGTVFLRLFLGNIFWFIPFGFILPL